MTSFYPIHVNIKGRKCLVVGGGKTAERKVKTLVRYGGKVVVVSPTATEAVKRMAQRNKILWLERTYRVSDLYHAFLVMAATDDMRLNSQISREAKKRGILINVVDSPEACDFISPSLVERGYLQLSISTGGVAPILSKKIRKDLEKKFGNEYRPYTQLIARARGAILKHEKFSEKEKKEKLELLVSLNILGKLKKGERVHYQRLLKQLGVSG